MNLHHPWDMDSIEILSTKKFCDLFLEKYQTDLLIRGLMNIKFCKLDRLGEAYLATFAVPDMEEPSRNKKTFGFCLIGDKLCFFDDTDTVRPLIEEINRFRISDMDSPVLFLYHFLEQLIRNDIAKLQNYEDRLSQLEGLLLQTELRHFEQQIFTVRKDLSKICSYYRQLSDVCETIGKYMTAPENPQYSQLYELLDDKVERLLDMVQMLIDYSIQLREMHETGINMRQNQIMQTLTMVTTLFMPLSLIAAWYGMNFASMPELTAKHGYPAIIALCLVVICLEIIVFRKKRWFWGGN